MRRVFLVSVLMVMAWVGFFFQGRNLYILSRLYEGAFFYWQYDYLGWNDPKYVKEVSYKNKKICHRDHVSKEIGELLEGKVPPQKWMIKESERRKTFWVKIGSREYLVKGYIQRGFLKGIFHLGKGIAVWNNLYWARERGLSMVEPIAFMEKRTPSEVVSFVIYEYEGASVNHVENQALMASMPQIQDEIESLKEEHVVHPDLRMRNMILLHENQIKFIDVDLLHFYPRDSLVYRVRMAEEEKWFYGEVDKKIES